MVGTKTVAVTDGAKYSEPNAINQREFQGFFVVVSNPHMFPVGMELRVNQQWRLGKKIGSGSFGDIYIGEFVIRGKC